MSKHPALPNACCFSMYLLLNLPNCWAWAEVWLWGAGLPAAQGPSSITFCLWVSQAAGSNAVGVGSPWAAPSAQGLLQMHISSSISLPALMLTMTNVLDCVNPQIKNRNVSLPWVWATSWFCRCVHRRFLWAVSVGAQAELSFAVALSTNPVLAQPHPCTAPAPAPDRFFEVFNPSDA